MDLKINYGETITVGNQIVNKGNEFQDLLNRIKNINAELQTYWEGQDASKYTTAVNEQAEQMQKLATTINEIGEFLGRVGRAYQEAAESNAGSIH